MKNEAQKYEAIERALGIISHEFPQEVIDRCRDDVLARNERIESGQTTFEQEDALLIERWKALQAKNQQRLLNGETTFEEEDAALMAEWRELNKK